MTDYRTIRRAVTDGIMLALVRLLFWLAALAVIGFLGWLVYLKYSDAGLLP